MPSSSGSEKGIERNGVRGGGEVKRGGEEIASKTLMIQSKRFYLDIKQNDRGRFVKLAEVAMNGRKNRLFMSMRMCKNVKELLEKFEDHVPNLEEANGKSDNATIHSESVVTERRRYYIDLRENRRGAFLRITQGLGQLHDALDEILEEFGEGYLEEDSDLPESQTFRTDGKSFFFDPGHNARGDFLKITELKPSVGVRNTIAISIRAIPQFTQIMSKLYDDFQTLRAGEDVNVTSLVKKESSKEDQLQIDGKEAVDGDQKSEKAADEKT
uniref:Transcriptional activator protein Pur-alpha n=1 Tax=Globodera rostochiensis TaxID=31243 RepID=A0A914ICX4_GLORO